LGLYLYNAYYCTIIAGRFDPVHIESLPPFCLVMNTPEASQTHDEVLYQLEYGGPSNRAPEWRCDPLRRRFNTYEIRRSSANSDVAEKRGLTRTDSFFAAAYPIASSESAPAKKAVPFSPAASETCGIHVIIAPIARAGTGESRRAEPGNSVDVMPAATGSDQAAQNGAVK
jgi:hypothetical protein